jgi:Protein of unknown function (DUF551)
MLSDLLDAFTRTPGGQMSEWKTIDSAPRDGRFFYVWIPALHDQGFIAVQPAWWNATLGRVCACYDDNLNDYEFTHWQPLPEPPATSDKVP